MKGLGIDEQRGQMALRAPPRDERLATIAAATSFRSHQVLSSNWGGPAACRVNAFIAAEAEVADGASLAEWVIVDEAEPRRNLAADELGRAVRWWRGRFEFWVGDHGQLSSVEAGMFAASGDATAPPATSSPHPELEM